MSDRDEKTQELLTALSQVKDPVTGKDVVSLERVEGLTHCEGAVKLTLRSQTPAKPVLDVLRNAAEAALKSVPWVEEVNLKIEAPQPPPATGEAPPKITGGAQRCIAIGSGKGGVGKSTVAVNLAASLARQGHRVGLLDADIYGPSIPTMLGVFDKPNVERTDAGAPMLSPLEAHGLQLMSVGFLVEGDQPLIWRGPMLHKMLSQFFKEVAWKELDYLLIDLPPGTGDVVLSLAQQLQLAGAIIVSTPQEVAMADARKALNMFNETKVEILGIVENMSGEIFGEGGAERWAKDSGVPFLGRTPLDGRIREAGDRGVPAATAEEASLSGPWAEMASTLHGRLEERGGGRKRISIKR